MNAAAVLAELEKLGSESYKRTLMKNHGVKEPFFGVKIGDLKPLRKRLGHDYRLALDLYATGNYDAMYLAGLIADDARMTQTDLRQWAKQAYGGCLPGTTVPTVAAGSPHGHALALEWIEAKEPRLAAIGWSTLSCLVALKPDAELDLVELRRLLTRVAETIRQAPDAVRYQMNNFLIAVGCYVAPLTELALSLGEKMGPVTADLGNNECQVPAAPAYIRKVQERGAIGKKRKTVKC